MTKNISLGKSEKRDRHEIFIGFKFMAMAEYLENKLGRKVDLLTPDGLKTIHIKQVAEKIKKSLKEISPENQTI